MKIIMVDNFNSETKDDILIAENVQPYYAQFIADMLNDKYGGADSPDFFRAVQDEYVLFRWEP